MPGVDAEARTWRCVACLPTALERATDDRRRHDQATRRPGRSRPASRRARAPPPTAATLFREADAALAFGKRHGRTCVTVFDAEQHATAGAERPTRTWRRSSPRSPRPARCAPCSSRSSTCATAPPRGYEGLDPADARLRLRRRERAVRRGRGGRADRRAGPGLPARRRSPAFARLAPARQPDPQRLAADARVRRVQRPRPRPAAPAPRRRPRRGSSWS